MRKLLFLRTLLLDYAPMQRHHSFCMNERLNAFLNHLGERGYTVQTVRQYRAVLTALLRAAGTETLTTDHVAAFVGKAKAAATRNSRLAAVRSFFRFLVRAGALEQNPAEELVYARADERSPAYLTPPELTRFFAAVASTSPYPVRDTAVVSLLFHSALRVGELHSLDLSQFSRERREFISVRLKGGRVRNVPVGVGAIASLEAWLADRPSWTAAATSPAIFLSERGRLAVRTIEQGFQRWSSAANLPQPIGPHGMRHSSATELMRRGVPIEVISVVLNHRRLETTLRYAHLGDRRPIEALDLLASDDSSRTAA